MNLFYKNPPSGPRKREAGAFPWEQGLYGRNNRKDTAIAKPDPALIAVLINREHSRQGRK